ERLGLPDPVGQADEGLTGCLGRGRPVGSGRWPPSASRAGYVSRRSLGVSVARCRRAQPDRDIAITTTRNPMKDRLPATGALCVSRRRWEYACHVSAAAESTAPAKAIGRVMPGANRLI